MISDNSNTIKKAFPDILKKSMGIISTACEKAKINRSTYYEWRKTDTEFAEACDEANEFAGDFVESKLYKNIDSGDTSCIIFYCKTKLKNRGYVERQEITGANGNGIDISVTPLQERNLDIISRATGENG